MTLEELLKPRYKVIADYPNCPFDKNEIIFPWNGASRKDKDLFTTIRGGLWDLRVNHYPHLFKRLEWWEERDVKDMPGYVKIKEDTRGLYDLETFGQLWKKGTIVKPIRWIGASPLITTKEFVLPCFVVPATESEYKEYINRIKE